MNSKRAQLITRHVGLVIAKDLRPYSVVENSGFKHLVNVLDPKYVLPSRPHFSQVVIPELYSETKAAVQDDLDKALSVALTTDGWTSRSTESYLTVTAHFIDDDRQMKDYVLQTRPLHESHTGKNIADVLTAAVSDWGLSRPTGLKPLVTDNASNVILAGREGNFTPHIGCFAYTINLATQRVLKVAGLARLLGRLRRVVSFFHHSATAAHLFQDSPQATVSQAEHRREHSMEHLI